MPVPALSADSLHSSLSGICKHPGKLPPILSLACLDGIGQVFDGSLQFLVPICKTVNSSLHFLGVSADAKQFVETSERHRVQQSSDTFHKGTAYLFEQVSAEDIVEYSGYRIEMVSINDEIIGPIPSFSKSSMERMADIICPMTPALDRVSDI